MSAYYEPKTDRGYLRLLISDVANGDRRLFDDGELDEFLTREGSVKLAAATALTVMAGNELMIAKVIDTGDLRTNGAAVSAELRALADRYRTEHAATSAEGDPYAVVRFEPYGIGVPELTERQVWP